MCPICRKIKDFDTRNNVFCSQDNYTQLLINKKPPPEIKKRPAPNIETK